VTEHHTSNRTESEIIAAIFAARLYARTIERTGPTAKLLECDDNIPSCELGQRQQVVCEATVKASLAKIGLRIKSLAGIRGKSAVVSVTIRAHSAPMGVQSNSSEAAMP
jgi:hypothetical protein